MKKTIRIGIMTISDRSSLGEREDLSGPALREMVILNGWECTETIVIPDDLQTIQGYLIDWSDHLQLALILTTGGTGFGPRDTTPEATQGIIEKLTPGICEAIRSASLAITPHAMLSRAVAGIRGKTLIINLPGSPKGACESFGVVLPILPHAIDLLNSDPDAENNHRRSS